MFMAISRDERLRNVSTSRHLPPHWTTLYNGPTAAFGPLGLPIPSRIDKASQRPPGARRLAFALWTCPSQQA